MGDPERYREKDEVQKWEKDDPIGRYRKHLIDNEMAAENELDEIDEKVDVEVQDAVEFAESSPDPEPEALFEDVYVEAV